MGCLMAVAVLRPLRWSRSMSRGYRRQMQLKLKKKQWLMMTTRPSASTAAAKVICIRQPSAAHLQTSDYVVHKEFDRTRSSGCTGAGRQSQGLGHVLRQPEPRTCRADQYVRAGHGTANMTGNIAPAEAAARFRGHGPAT